MLYEAFASDIPLSRSVEFRSAEENEETMQRLGVNQQVRQLSKGRFRSHLAVHETEQADLFADRFNQACSIYLEVPPGTVALLVFRSAGGRFLASGANVANDKLFVLPDDSGTDLVTPPLAGSEAIVVAKSRFIEMTEVLCPGYARPEGAAVIQGNTAQLHALRRAMLNLMARPELDSRWEHVPNLVAQLIAWMGDNSSQRRPEGLKATKTRIRVAKHAQEFIEEHYREPVRIEDLCRETGCGVRTLQRCFREYFDLTITDYLKTVRLSAAHRALAATHPSQKSVASIARRHGFNHLGRFSREYHERFGELPSETLANRKSCPWVIATT